MRRLLLVCFALTGAAIAQIPLPTFTSSYTYNGHTRGFWFTAPSSFIITQLNVPNEASYPEQNVQVGLFAGAPTGGLETITDLGTFTAQPTTGPIATAILVNQGDEIIIHGACGDAVQPGGWANSYGAGPFPTSILGNAVTLRRAGSQTNINVTGGTGQCFGAAGGSLGRVEVWIAAPSGYATKLSFGEGCNAQYASFYENHVAFDLSGTSLSMTNLGTGYVGIAGTNAIVPPTAAPFTIGDDQVVQQSLGWTLPYPGGTTTDVWVSSNGFLHLVSQTANGCCSLNVAMFLSSGPVFAAKWRDLNPAGGGTVTFETDPVAGTATVTFDQVPDYGSTTNLNSFQYAFDSTGTVELRFGTCAATAGGTGWSPGLANLDPGSIDISATPVIVTEPVDVLPLALDGDARPVLGTTVTMTVDNVPTGTAIGAMIYGLIEHNPGIDLTSFGMPGCFQFCSQDAVALTIAPTGPFTNLFVVPNAPGLVGVVIKSQGAIFNPNGGHNAIGALSSNGVRLTLDIN